MHQRTEMGSRKASSLMGHSFSYTLPPGEGFMVGEFHYDIPSERWHWSAGAFAIHGFEPGDVVPTTPLVLAHKHPDDRAAFEMLFQRVQKEGGAVVSHHRIIDGHGVTRSVVMVAEGHRDDTGTVVRVSGHFADLSKVFERESSVVADEAVARAVEKREFIEQAKGVLMGQFHVDSDAAFEMLVRRSQHDQRKLRDIAVDLVKSTSYAPAADTV